MGDDNAGDGEPQVTPAAALLTGGSTRPILVGYDGSASSKHALVYAARQAGQEAQPLLLAHIHASTASYDTGFGWPDPPQDPAELVEWLQAELTELVDTRDLPVQIVEGSGHAARRIAELAAEHHVAAIVLGAPEHRLHHLIGSVPAWLSRHARCPVTIVP